MSDSHVDQATCSEQSAAEWSKTLEWIEKQTQDSMKSRFATADLIAKEAQTTLTVLLAGVGGTAAYAAKVFEPGSASAIEVAAAVTCGYLIVLSVSIVLACMMFRSYPAQYQQPKNLLLKELSLDELREEELKNLDDRIREAGQINVGRATNLNRIRLAAAMSPLVFCLAAVLPCSHAKPTAAKASISCKLGPVAASGVVTASCEVSK